MSSLSLPAKHLVIIADRDCLALPTVHHVGDQVEPDPEATRLLLVVGDLNRQARGSDVQSISSIWPWNDIKPEFRIWVMKLTTYNGSTTLCSTEMTV